MRIFLASLFCISSVLDLQAAGAPLPPGQIVSWDKFEDTSSLLTAGWQYCAAIAGATGPTVTVRYVGPIAPPGYHQPVFFSSQTAEVLLASSLTNHNCFLNGRLFRVDVAMQSLYVTPSTSLGTNVFTPESALEFAKRAFIAEHGDPGPYPLTDSAFGGWARPGTTNAFVLRALNGRGAGGPGVLVVLDPLLSQLRPPPPQTAGIMGVTDVAIGPRGTNLAVTFKLHCTCTRLVTKVQGPSTVAYPAYSQPVCDGTVVLDPNLNVVSTSLNEP